ncbi:uncharacterized protein RAG0_09521 [Rhynchosporium agropyri]|uniref:Uncharacterized protein n=1 Tax=Rhynchosporium agropyri TaxID=914238 RepID=A0A1E1KVU5_9HELO|nr:uncharacterized protein RAG0_09521 [Rhynchosporium agropyri]
MVVQFALGPAVSCIPTPGKIRRQERKQRRRQTAPMKFSFSRTFLFGGFITLAFLFFVCYAIATSTSSTVKIFEPKGKPNQQYLSRPDKIKSTKASSSDVTIKVAASTPTAIITKSNLAGSMTTSALSSLSDKLLNQHAKASALQEEFKVKYTAHYVFLKDKVEALETMVAQVALLMIPNAQCSHDATCPLYQPEKPNFDADEIADMIAVLLATNRGSPSKNLGEIIQYIESRGGSDQKIDLPTLTKLLLPILEAINAINDHDIKFTDWSNNAARRFSENIAETNVIAQGCLVKYGAGYKGGYCSEGNARCAILMKVCHGVFKTQAF